MFEDHLEVPILSNKTLWLWGFIGILFKVRIPKSIYTYLLQLTKSGLPNIDTDNPGVA